MSTSSSPWASNKATLLYAMHLFVFMVGWKAIFLAFVLLGLRSGLSFGVEASIALHGLIVPLGALLRERSLRWSERRRGNELGPVTMSSVLWAMAPILAVFALSFSVLATLQAPQSPTLPFQKALFLLSASSSFIIMAVVDEQIPGPRLFRWRTLFS